MLNTYIVLKLIKNKLIMHCFKIIILKLANNNTKISSNLYFNFL